MGLLRVLAVPVVALLAVTPAIAQSPTDPAEEGAIEQSCKLLLGSGTAGAPDELPAEPSVGIPSSWPEAPVGLGPESVPLRTETETFNRLYEFATRNGMIYGRNRGDDGPWRELPLPLCFSGRVESISLDDDEMIALDTARRIFTMDNALKEAVLFNWTSRWGTPVWTGLGYTLPGAVKAWSWSVISRLEDGSWIDPAGNRTAIGSGKVSHIWGLRAGGQRITFWDPWLAPDESYEMCGPHRGRFRSINLSASGSAVFLIGRRGDLFTRFYDFDISGHDPVFFKYSYEDQRGKGDGSPIQLPAEPWTEQPKIPGQITSAISIHKQGEGATHRILRVEGKRKGRTGYWERDVADPKAAGWSFDATGLPLTGKFLRNPRRDSSARGLGPSQNRVYRMEGEGITAELTNFNVYCSPARLLVTEDDETRELVLHHIDGLRQLARAPGLDDVPREQPGAIEGPPGEFRNVTVQASRDEIVIEELDWTFRHVVQGR